MNTIQATLTPNAVGLVLHGSQHDLMNLYDAIYQVLPPDDYEDDNLLYLLGLSYDIRKAYSGYTEEQTDIQPVAPKTSGVYTIETTYSVKIILPILIVQLHILSEYLHSFQGDKQYLEVIINFKNVVLNAIKINSQDIYEKVKSWLEITNLFSKNYIFNIVTHLSAIEYIQFKPAANRLRSLPTLLKTFNESHPKYQEFSQLGFDVNYALFEQLDNGQINW